MSITIAAPRASFSNDSQIIRMPLPKSVLLKDYLLDDLSSCSSNGFRSYPRRQCCTKVRYLIEIDLNKHIKLPQTQSNIFKCKSKSKSKLKMKLRTRSSSVLHRASKAVVNVFKSFQFSKRKKTDFVPRNLSRKLLNHGFWRRTTDQHKKEFKRLNSFDEPIERKEKILHPASEVSAVATTAEMKTSTSNSNSNSFASLDSYFTATSDSSTTGDSSIINVAQNDVVESELLATEKMNMSTGDKPAAAAAIATATATTTTTTTTTANANEQKKLRSNEKDQFSPVSVMDFVCDDDNNDEDEVTSPFQHFKGFKRKLMPHVQRTKNLAQLKPVRLEDRITSSETKTQQGCATKDVNNQTEKKAIALLQLLKTTMSIQDQSESKMTEGVMLGFFIERLMEGNVSDYIILQEAKDWLNGQTKEMLDYQNNKLTYIRDMEKGVKWFKYDDEVEELEVGIELEYEVFTSLVEEMLLDFYL